MGDATMSASALDHRQNGLWSILNLNNMQNIQIFKCVASQGEQEEDIYADTNK